MWNQEEYTRGYAAGSDYVLFGTGSMPLNTAGYSDEYLAGFDAGYSDRW